MRVGAHEFFAEDECMAIAFYPLAAVAVLLLVVLVRASVDF
jgi:hypothetical protein